MASDFLIVSFYTKDTPYEKEYETLMASLEKFNLPCYIEAIESKGSWVANCSYKSTFCKEMLAIHKKPIVWVDCDAEILQYPSLFLSMQDFDIGCHYFTRKSGKVELLSGTLFFNYTDASRELINRWEDACKNSPARLDQKTLEDTIKSYETIKIFDLPQSYVNIFDDGRVSLEDTVILHRQASRRFKRII
jgi:hypothetical protein